MTTSLSKLRMLLVVLGARPTEFLDRVRAVLEVKIGRLTQRTPTYHETDWSELLSGLTRALGIDVVALNREIDDYGLELTVAADIVRVGPGRVSLRHNADFRLARLCYIICRALQPQVVVETGVANGVTTTFVLKALETNRRGHLHSIDLPPLGVPSYDFIGRLVPPQLRSRWTLLRGASRRVLPSLLGELGHVDVFIHDSLHTFHNMRAEFAAVHRYRADYFVLIADDIESNSAFEKYLEESGPAVSFHATFRETAKNSWCGMCVLQRTNDTHTRGSALLSTVAHQQ